MRVLEVSRDEAEDLVDLLEADAGCCTFPRSSQVAIDDRDWRLRMAADLREQWGMCDRETERAMRSGDGPKPDNPRLYKR